MATWVPWGALRMGMGCGGVCWKNVETTVRRFLLALHFWRQGAREGGSAGLGLVCLRGGGRMLAENAVP